MLPGRIIAVIEPRLEESLHHAEGEGSGLYLVAIRDHYEIFLGLLTILKEYDPFITVDVFDSCSEMNGSWRIGLSTGFRCMVSQCLMEIHAMPVIDGVAEALLYSIEGF